VGELVLPFVNYNNEVVAYWPWWRGGLSPLD
jgi:hypothetical protein